MSIRDWAVKRKDVLHVYIFTAVWLFVPNVFSIEIPTPLAASGSPVVEDKNSAGIPPLGGVGGPEDDLEFYFQDEADHKIVGLNDRGPGLTTSGSESPPVYRINYLNYASAILPVDSPEISSDFGWRSPPCSGCSADHRGVDFVPGAGKPIYAILDGMVVESGFLGGYGYWVKLEHIVPNPGTNELENWETVYAHMQEDSIPEEVKVGAVVKKGEIIGRVGNTGMSTGPHLHFELRIEGEQIDPLPFISEYQTIEIEETRKELELEIAYR